MAESREQLEDAHKALSRDFSYQQELPDLPDAPSDFEAPEWLRVLGQILDAIFSFLGPILQVLLIGAGVVLLLYILFSIGRAFYERRHRMAELMRRRPQPKETLDDVDMRPDEAFARNLLEEADRLAALGKFGEAVRTLLHSSIEDMRERVRQRIGIAMTAREIGRIGSMPDTSRSALQRIIHKVEISVFGHSEVLEADYKDARADYSTFAFGGGKGMSETSKQPGLFFLAGRNFDGRHWCDQLFQPDGVDGICPRPGRQGYGGAARIFKISAGI